MRGMRRVVFDCNTLLQGLAHPGGPAGKCVQLALDHEVTVYISAVVLAELRDVANRPRVARKLKLTPERVELFLLVLQRAAVTMQGFKDLFEYPRDPDDAHYVNLALAAGATLIVSRDKDLLELMDSTQPAGRDFRARFPALRIVAPPEFLVEVAGER